jgi:hypothetical protein
MGTIDRRKWERVSKYAMKYGNWIVGKNYLDGCTLYTVAKDGGPILAYLNDFDECKDWINAHSDL